MKSFFFFLLIHFFCLSVYSQVDTTFISLSPEQYLRDAGMMNDKVIIDVREFFEYRRSRIPGSVNIPSFGSWEQSFDSIPLSKKLFLYCTSGSRSTKMAKKLKALGYMNVYNLEGGINAWRQNDYPVDRKKVKK